MYGFVYLGESYVMEDVYSLNVLICVIINPYS